MTVRIRLGKRTTMAASDPYTVLFLCTGNSARSILSEVLLRDLGGARFRSFSAGSKPSGSPHPDALSLLKSKGHDVTGLSSKSWDVFSSSTSPEIDLSVTVCANAAGEVCPVFNGANCRVHWPAPDPAHIVDEVERQRMFETVYALCQVRIEALVNLPDEALQDREALQAIANIT